MKSAVVGIVCGLLAVMIFGPFFCDYTSHAMSEDCGGNRKPVAVIEVS